MIAKFMGPTWGPPGSNRPQMGPMSAPWTLLSGCTVYTNNYKIVSVPRQYKCGLCRKKCPFLTRLAVNITMDTRSPLNDEIPSAVYITIWHQNCEKTLEVSALHDEELSGGQACDWHTETQTLGANQKASGKSITKGQRSLLPVKGQYFRLTFDRFKGSEPDTKWRQYNFTQHDAGNDNTRRPKLASGKIRYRVRY